MFKSSTTVLRVFDIEIKLAASWFLIAALITWSLADQVFPQKVPGLSTFQYIALGTFAMLLFFMSLLLHELAHAWVAKSFGIKVRQVTLFLFGGVAELDQDPDTAQHEFWIAVAGPVMSVSLASFFWILSGLIAIASNGTSMQSVANYLATINLVLAVFNMLPAFPLDGGRVLRAVLWSRTGDIWMATKSSTRLGEILGFGIIALGLLTLFQGNHLAGAWQIMIGTFLLFAARAALENLRVQAFLGDQKIDELMSKNVSVADPGLSLAGLVNGVMLPHRVSFVPVVENGVLLGHIDTAVLSMIDHENWPTTCVGDIFVELDADLVVSPGTPAIDVLKRISGTGKRKLIVVKDRRLVGVVTLSDLNRLIELLAQLQLQPRHLG